MHEWRRRSVQLAIARDNGKCVVCWFLHGRKATPQQQVHHVYSRDRKEGGWREHYTNLMCVCQEHHPPPIITPGASSHLGWVEELLHQANRTPINREFIHDYKPTAPTY